MPKHLLAAALLEQAQQARARMNGGAFNRSGKPLPGADGRDQDAWYRIVNAVEDEANVFIYSDIGIWGLAASDFVHDFLGITAPTINVRINSPGGSVFDGIAIYQAIAQKDANVIVHIDGWAASIASIIAMAGDEIRIGEAAQLMIHKPWSFVVGDANDMKAEADILDAIEESLIDIYVARTGGDRAQIQKWVEAETWFKGKAAVDAGFADEVVPLKGADSAKAMTKFGAELFSAAFKNLPDDVRSALSASRPAAKSIKTERELEALLREAGGFSRAEAKRIVNTGFKSEVRPGVEQRAGTADHVDLRDADDEEAKAAVEALNKLTASIKSRT